MSDVDFTGLSQQLAGKRLPPVSEFAPRRVRSDRHKAEIVTEAEPEVSDPEQPLTEEIKQNALRVSMMVGNLQEREKQANAALAEANARIEQFKARETDLLSQLETSRIETSEAVRRTDEEREARVRLSAILENIGGLVADGLQK